MSADSRCTLSYLSLAISDILHSLTRKEADLSIAGLAVSLERKKTIEFTTGVFTSEVGLIVAKTNYVPIDYMVYINVFLASLWVGISVLIVALTSGFLGVHMVLGEKLHLEVRSNDRNSNVDRVARQLMARHFRPTERHSECSTPFPSWP